MTMPLPEVRGGIAISGIYELEPIRLNYILSELVQSGSVSVAEFEAAVEKRRAYIDEIALMTTYKTPLKRCHE
jgi:hypothetical protein